MAAFVAALAAAAALVGQMVTYERSVNDGMPDGPISRQEQGSQTLPVQEDPEPDQGGRGATGWIISAIVLGVPSAAAATSLFARSRTSALVTRSIAAGVLALWTLLLAFGGGLFLLPATVMMAASAIMAATANQTAPMDPRTAS